MGCIRNVFYPKAFHGKYIRTHWDFEGDLEDILDKSGKKADFWGKYKQRLQFLEERKRDCILRKNWFEKLKHVNDLYAVLFDKSEKNIRILFSFIEYKGVEYAVFLYAFEEKDNKKNSRFSYSTGIPVAQKRLKEVLSK